MNPNDPRYDDYKELINETARAYNIASSDWMLGNLLASYYDDPQYLHLSKEDTIQGLLDVEDVKKLAALAIESLEYIDKYVELHIKAHVFAIMQGLDPAECIGIIRIEKATSNE